MAQEDISDSEIDIGLGLNNLIAKDIALLKMRQSQARPVKVQDIVPESDEHDSQPQKRPIKEPKYNLFPAQSRMTKPASGRSTPDIEKIQALEIPRSSSALSDRGFRSLLNSSVRLKHKDRTTNGRRKASVPELGPMTTVQEAPMDSPTIPGRPPLHERSASAPVPWETSDFVHTVPTLASLRNDGTADCSPPSSRMGFRAGMKKSSSIRRRLLHNGGLPPLHIPPNDTKTIQTKVIVRARSASDDERPPKPPPKSPTRQGGRRVRKYSEPSTKTDMETVSVPYRAKITTPLTAPEERTVAKPWSTPITAKTSPQAQATPDLSVMDRGRPTKRRNSANRTASCSTKRAGSSNQTAFEFIPRGFKAVEATGMYSRGEVEVLQDQARGQAAQFEVLSAKDVDNLSRELRALDERCEHLRTTHVSLRSGRQGLHARLVAYLASPRIAQYSRESVLKQEEALAELDASIDDWVTKLEQAENRRTRVRQKLLEHVAAAVTLPVRQRKGSIQTATTTTTTTTTTPVISPSQTRSTSETRSEAQSTNASSSVASLVSAGPRPPLPNTTSFSNPWSNAILSGNTNAAGVVRSAPIGEETPPTSPEKMCGPSPRSTITPVPPPHEADTAEARRRRDVESIKVYADSTVYTFFADLESETEPGPGVPLGVGLTEAWIAP